MARKVVRVDEEAEGIARELADKEGVSLNEATEVLIKAGAKYLNGGGTKKKAKSNGKTVKVSGLDKEGETYVKLYAQRKGITQDQARTELCVIGIGRRRALDKDHAKRAKTKTPAKKKAKRKAARKR